MKNKVWQGVELLLIVLILILVFSYESFADTKCCGYDDPQNTYECYNANCTWWAAYKRPECNFPGGDRDAKRWLDLAEKNGLPTGDRPQKGSIAVFKNMSGTGHVAYVTRVSGESFYVTEMFYNKGCGSEKKENDYKISEASGFIFPGISVKDYFPIKYGKKYKYEIKIKNPWGSIDTEIGTYEETFDSPVKVGKYDCYGRFWKGNLKNRDDERYSCICIGDNGMFGITEMFGFIEDKLSCDRNTKITGKENYLLKYPLEIGTKWPVYSKVNVPNGAMEEVGNTTIKNIEKTITIKGREYSDCIVTETTIPAHKTSLRDTMTNNVSYRVVKGTQRSYYCKDVGQILTIVEHINGDTKYNLEKTLMK